MRYYDDDDDDDDDYWYYVTVGACELYVTNIVCYFFIFLTLTVNGVDLDLSSFHMPPLMETFYSLWRRRV